MKCVIKITKNYGREAIYPMCANAINFSNLTGKKTFSRWDLKIIQQLGFEIVIEAQQIIL